MGDDRSSLVVYRDGDFLQEGALRVSPFDPALLCGFSLYETLLCEKGRTFRLDAHRARMEGSARRLGLEPVPPLEGLRAIAADLAGKNGIETGRLRLTLLGTDGSPPSSFLATLAPYTPPSARDREIGWSCEIVSLRRHTSDPLTGHKTGNFLAAKRLRDALPPRTEGLLLNEHGRVAEGCFTNVFAVAEGTLLTPLLGEGCLPGVTRAAVIECAKAAGLEALESTLDPEALGAADEAFLTNALMGIVPLTAFAGRPIGRGAAGPLTTRLAGSLEALVARDRV